MPNTDDLTEALTVVGRTALAVSLAREVESRRTDAWFADPLARQLRVEIAGTRFEQDLEPVLRGEALVAWIAVRTRFLDDLVARAVAAGVRQLVIVGAGLDARAYRLQLPDGFHIYELDRSDVLAVKDRILSDAGVEPVASRSVVTADVMQESWLDDIREAGWQSALPTIWIMEGFLIYFEDAVRRRLLRQIAAGSAEGSLLGATVSTSIDNDTHSLWQAFDGGDLVSWFAESGWDARVAGMPEVAEHFGRPVAPEDRDRVEGVLVAARPLPQ